MFGAFIVFKGEDCPVLFRNVDVPYHGNDSQHGLSRVFLRVTVRRGKQGGIPPEFVDHESRQQFPFPRGEGHPRAQEGGVHAAPVNVPGEQDFSAGVAGHVHVDHVRGFQVDFPRTSGPFQADQVVFVREGVVGGADVRPEPALGREVFPGFHVPYRLSHHDDLGTRVGVGFEQDGVHPGVRVYPAGLGLDHLGAAHFLSQRGHAGVEGHVLRLEGGHAEAVLMEDAAEGRRQHAFARIGTGALNHQRRLGGPAQDGGSMFVQFHAKRPFQKFVFFRSPDSGAEPAARFQARIIGAVPDGNAVFFQQQGSQAGRSAGKAEEKEVGAGRQNGSSRQRGQSAEQVFPARPVQSAFLFRPGRGLFQDGPHRRRCEDIHIPRGKIFPQPFRQKGAAYGKTAADARHAVEFGQGAQNNEVGKGCRVRKEGFFPSCIVNE